jgi:hypothetical protein
MAKTRRKKINRSPGKPYRNSKAFITEKGEMVTLKGVRGRTKVVRVTNDDDKRITSVRSVMIAPQVVAKPVGDRRPTPIFVGRVYTGVARSKPYPYRGKKRGAVEQKPVGLMARAARAVKRVVVRDDGGLAVK